MGHEKEGAGIEFEFSSSSRSLESIFWGRGGAPVHFEFGYSASKASLHDPGGGTGCEQFENNSRTQLVISSRTVEE